MLAAPSRSHSQPEQNPPEQLPPLESQLSSHQMSGQATPSQEVSHEPADVPGNKFAEVVRQVMQNQSNAKMQVQQHISESPDLHDSGTDP